MEHWLGLLQNGRRSSSPPGSLSHLPQLCKPNKVLCGCSQLTLGLALSLLLSLTACLPAVFLWPLVAGIGWDWSPSCLVVLRSEIRLGKRVAQPGLGKGLLPGQPSTLASELGLETC